MVRVGAVLLSALSVLAIGAHAEDEEEEEVEVSPLIQSGSVMIILTLMVLFSVGFEQAKDMLFEKTTESLMPVLNSLFSELTLLGFIGLSLFIIDKLQVVSTLSENVFGEEGYIGELCEAVHMALFLVMVLFLSTVILLIMVAQSVNKQWKAWEENILDQDSLRQEYQDMLLVARRWRSYYEPLTFRKAVYASIRARFIHDAEIDEQFDFSDYLSYLSGSCLAEVVEVPVTTWMGLELFMLVCWGLFISLPPLVLGGCLVVFGYAVPLALRVIHMKVRKIKFDVALIADFPKVAAYKIDLAQENSRLLDDSRTSNGAIERSMDSSVEADAFSWFFAPSSYELDKLIHHFGRTNINKKKNHAQRFWFGDKLRKEAPDFAISLIRYSLLFNSIYIAVFLLIFLPALLAENLSIIELLVVVVVAMVPPYNVLTLTPFVIKDLAMVANIENMRNKRVVEQGIRRLKTRNAFLALKVVYMMMKGVQASGIKAPAKKASKTAVVKQRAVWSNIFNTFDDDGSGALTHEEIKEMLKSALGDNITDEDIHGIITALDSNNDGSIDFDEFFAYAQKISSANAESPEEIANGIFTLVDRGSNSLVQGEEEESSDEEEEEDEIDIGELQDALNEMKQELSADDVFSVIRDIDEDGNGKLNREEFMEMLQRLEVI